VRIDPNKSAGLTITAPADAFADIETSVENGELIIDINSSEFMSPDIEVVIANSQLEAISIAGSGSFSGAVETRRDLRLTIDGSGNIDIKSNVDKVYAKISGSGIIVYFGNPATVDKTVYGSGSVSKN